MQNTSQTQLEEEAVIDFTGNAGVLAAELNWLQSVIENRIDLLDKEQGNMPYNFEQNMPLLNSLSFYGNLVSALTLNSLDRLLLISSLAPHLSPPLFGAELKDQATLADYAEFGGFFDPVFCTFVPTLQTVLYLAGGNNINIGFYNQIYLTGLSALVKEQVITLQALGQPGASDLLRNKLICPAPEYIRYVISGVQPRPDFGKTFPASQVTTSFEWEDLVVAAPVKKELERIAKWPVNSAGLKEKTGKQLNHSFTCLFYGPSGSGKTLAVQLLGKRLHMDVFKIDLSMVVSKYIGETEKNLAYLFDRARDKNWILFFDEADAMFGKRTDIKDSKDKWANLEMSYLLQRMEEHNGLTVLATNYKTNLDDALSRRFQSVIYFGRPEKEQRIALWKKLMPMPFVYEAGTDLEKLAQLELTGGNITNIIKAGCLDAECEGSTTVLSSSLADAIKREFAKENRSVH